MKRIKSPKIATCSSPTVVIIQNIIKTVRNQMKLRIGKIGLQTLPLKFAKQKIMVDSASSKTTLIQDLQIKYIKKIMLMKQRKKRYMINSKQIIAELKDLQVYYWLYKLGGWK